MRFITGTMAVILLGCGFIAMSQSYAHPGSLANPNETAGVFGAECYLPSPLQVFVCSGGLPPSNCMGCGCQLRFYPDTVDSSGRQGISKICDADPQCTFNDIDTSRFCNCASKGTSHESGEGGGTGG